MAEFTRMVTIHVEDLGEIADKLTELDVDLSTLATVDVEVDVSVDLDNFGDDAIIQAFNDISGGAGNWLERTYRLLAERDCDGAMEELHCQFPQLAPPLAREAACRPPVRQ